MVWNPEEYKKRMSRQAMLALIAAKTSGLHTLQSRQALRAGDRKTAVDEAILAEDTKGMSNGHVRHALRERTNTIFSTD